MCVTWRQASTQVPWLIRKVRTCMYGNDNDNACGEPGGLMITDSQSSLV